VAVLSLESIATCPRRFAYRIESCAALITSPAVGTSVYVAPNDLAPEVMLIGCC